MPWRGCSPGGRGPRGRHAGASHATLADTRTGAVVLVTDIIGRGRGAQRLQDLGLAVGTTVQIVSGHGRGPVVLAVGDTRLALGRGAAGRVIVEILTP